MKSDRENRPNANSKNVSSQAKPAKPLKGFLIAGGSLAVLFTIAYLKGRADD